MRVFKEVGEGRWRDELWVLVVGEGRVVCCEREKGWEGTVYEDEGMARKLMLDKEEIMREVGWDEMYDLVVRRTLVPVAIQRPGGGMLL